MWKRLLAIMDQALIKGLERQNKRSVFILAKAKELCNFCNRLFNIFISDVKESWTEKVC